MCKYKEVLWWNSLNHLITKWSICLRTDSILKKTFLLHLILSDFLHPVLGCLNHHFHLSCQEQLFFLSYRLSLLGAQICLALLSLKKCVTILWISVYKMQSYLVVEYSVHCGPAVLNDREDEKEYSCWTDYCTPQWPQNLTRMEMIATNWNLQVFSSSISMNFVSPPLFGFQGMASF